MIISGHTPCSFLLHGDGTNRSEKGVRMYRFPSESERRKKWLGKVSRSNLTITRDYRVDKHILHYDHVKLSKTILAKLKDIKVAKIQTTEK